MAALAPIGYLKVTNVTFTKAELSWTCPEIGDSLVRFDVRVVVDENDKFTKVIQGDKHRSVCLVNLTPDSLYTISVRCVTTEGPGPYSIPISFKAMKACIENLTVQNVTATTADLSWTCPDLGESLVRYDVRVTLPGGTEQVLEGSKSCSMSLIKLQPNTKYTISVRYVIKRAPGQYSVPISFTTQAGIKNLTVQNVTATAVELSWTCTDLGSTLVRFDVRMCRETDQITQVLEGHKLPYVSLVKLHPDTLYTLSVRFVDTNGPQPFNAAISFKTLSACIENLQVKRVTATTADLSWTCPELGESLTQFELQMYLGENRQMAKVMKGSKKCFAGLVQLIPGKLYTISVRCVLAGGPGPYSAPISFKTLEAFIENLEVKNITATTVDLSWTCPDLGNNLVRFDVKVTSEDNDESAQVIEGGKKRSISLNQLQPDTNYTMSARYVITQGPGPFSAPVSFTTLKGITTHRPLTTRTTRPRPKSAMLRYRMEAIPRGICVILNIRDFHGSPMETRHGTDIDRDGLKETFTSLHFEIWSYDNLKDTQMVRIMNKLALLDHAKYDCFVCCILSHGDDGVVYGSNGKAVDIKDLMAPFRTQSCPSLAGKPKVFFLQSCRGHEEQKGHTTVQTDSKRKNEKVQIPNDADFLLGYSTVSGHVAYRDRDYGSKYIAKLTELLKKHSEQRHLLEILTMVNDEVGKSDIFTKGEVYKQIPAPMFTLTKNLYFGHRK